MPLGEHPQRARRGDRRPDAVREAPRRTPEATRLARPGRRLPRDRPGRDRDRRHRAVHRRLAHVHRGQRADDQRPGPAGAYAPGMTTATLDWFGCATFRLVTAEGLTVMLDAYLDRVPDAPQSGVGVAEV